jgi:hypothetical protein
MIKKIVMVGFIVSLAGFVARLGAWVEPVCKDGSKPRTEHGVTHRLCGNGERSVCANPHHKRRKINCTAGICTWCMLESEWQMVPREQRDE